MEIFRPQYVDERGLSDIGDADDENVGLWVGRAVVPIIGLYELDRPRDYLKVSIE